MPLQIVLIVFVQQIFSRHSSPGSSGVNFFAQTLNSSEFFFVFPPVGLAVSAIKHLALFNCKGVLILPVWKKSPWYNFFFPDGHHAVSWIIKMIILNPTFISGIYVGPCFTGVKDYDTVAVSFDFHRHYLNFDPKLDKSHCLTRGCISCI